MAKILSHYFSTDKTEKLHYLESGTGEPLIFLPGLTFSATAFEQQIAYFATDYHVFALDPRGQGDSVKTAAGNDYFTHGKDLAALIAHKNLKNITLIGWSTGNLDIWSYVEQFDLAKIKKIVTIDMSPIPLSANEQDWREVSIEEAQEIATKVLNTNEGRQAFFTEYITEVMFQQTLSEDSVQAILALSNQTPDYVCKALFSDAILSNYGEVAKKISESVPSLMFIAEHWSNIAEPFMQKNFPKTDLHIMGGHMMFYEYPEKWNQVLADFLTK